MNWQQLKKVAAFYGRFTLSFTQIGYRARQLGWPRFQPDFHGQRWLVTGGSGGLGGWIATAAARAGAQVTAAARSEAKLAALRDAARAQGAGEIAIETCDFSLQSDTARLLDRLQRGGRAHPARGSSAPARLRSWSPGRGPSARRQPPTSGWSRARARRRERDDRRRGHRLLS